MRAVPVVSVALLVAGILSGCGADPADGAAAGREPSSRASAPADARAAGLPVPATAPPTAPPRTAAAPKAAPAPVTPPPPMSGRPAAETTGPRRPVAPPASSGLWTPAPGVSWQYQLTGRLDLGVDADVYDIEPDMVTATDMARLHARGAHALCYLSAGSLEDWREDADELPDAVVGRPLEGWDGEWWLDVRRTDVLVPWMAQRLDRCAALGFDGVEFDNVDGYTNETGFSLTAAHQLAYLRELTAAAHARGLSVALKNTPELADDLAGDVQMYVVEECYEWSFCGDYRAHVAAGRAVLAVEYQDHRPHCAAARAAGISLIGKDLDLGPGRQTC